MNRFHFGIDRLMANGFARGLVEVIGPDGAQGQPAQRGVLEETGIHQGVHVLIAIGVGCTEMYGGSVLA